MSSPHKKISHLVWLRNDLRLKDNPALYNALKTATDAVLLLYIYDEKIGTLNPSIGAASKWWLHEALISFANDIEKKNGRLVIQKGDSFEVISSLVKEHNISNVYWNRRFEPAQIDIDAKIKATLKTDDIHVKSFEANYLTRPWSIKTKTDQIYKVYTPYCKNACMPLLETSPPSTLPAPKSLSNSENDIKSLDIAELHLLPKINWYKTMNQAWDVSEKGATKQLNAAKDIIENYKIDRDIPSIEGTSKLSPYLHFGQISIRSVWETIKAQPASEGRQQFLKELIWREFAAYLLFHFPNFDTENFRPQFDKFKWEEDDEKLLAWQKGQTGYPLVDAGMRELWATGWMHNRVRMVVGSFLIKHLQQHWRKGAEWFWDTLVDADLANNSAGWQWVAGTGADASPYFRIFNPMTQAEKFDPSAEYVHKWVPELSKLSAPHIFRPWDAPEAVLLDASVELGKTYPYPIVDHATARQTALEKYKNIK